MSEEKKALSADAFAKGRLQLKTPIKDGEETIESLKFNFYNLTAMEYCEAMDEMSDSKSNIFTISFKQALCLFAISAAKESERLDKKDIMTRLSMVDAQSAVKVTTIFFRISSNSANERLLDE